MSCAAIDKNLASLSVIQDNCPLYRRHDIINMRNGDVTITYFCINLNVVLIMCLHFL